VVSADRPEDDAWNAWSGASPSPTDPVDARAVPEPPSSPAAAAAPAPVPAPAPSTDPPPAPRRRWPWAVAVVLLVALTATATLVALDQRETAAAWQQRAEELEAEREAEAARGGELEQQLDEVVVLLGRSEQDVSQLEQRLRQLADEKAQAEDAAITGEVERELLVDVSGRVTDAVDALDACISRLFELQAASVEAFNRSAAGQPVDVAPLNVQATDITAFCNEARRAAAQAGAAADQLLAP
jgi:TolA-binding protein